MIQGNFEIIQKDGQIILKRYTGFEEKITIPKGIIEIGNYEFSEEFSLTPIKIPESVRKIEDFVFVGHSSLVSMAIYQAVIPQGVTVIGDSAFKGWSFVTSVVIPEGVTEIGESAFEDCNFLTIVQISESVTKIGERAFANCPKLTIHAPAGSKAEEYAQANGIPFEAN